MKKIIFFPLLIILLSILFSCNDSNTLEENIVGLWLIEDLNYKNENITDLLSLNTISFREKTGGVPGVGEFEKDEDISWSVLTSRDVDSILIETENPIFNGQYKILFATDELNSVFAKLVSEDTVIEIRKIELGI